MYQAFFASESELHAHRSIARREKALAEELRKQILSLGAQEEFLADDRYRQLAKQADSLRTFLFAMSDAMEDFERIVRETAAKTAKILRDAPDEHLLHPKINLD